jgi:starch phosphorylase
MVAVGLLYRQGYFHQQLDTSGWQREHWVETDPERLPATLVTGTDGRAISVTVEISGHLVAVQVWRVDVGRIPLFLLDTDRPENSRADRWITSRVYVGDWRVRLAQYAVLGVGGVRALRSMGVEPGVVHLNEGHAALAPLELARERVARGASFEEAIAWAKERTVFTTHTPVAAGNEAYMAEDFIEVLGSYPGELGVEVEQVLRLGRSRPDDPGEAFGLTPLGVRMSRTANGVSRVHGRTARTMWQELFPGRDADDVPIGHVTNGVHLPSWMALPMRRLLDQHLGEGWPARATDQAVWDGLDSITDRELWAVRGELRASLVDYVRTQSVEDRLSRGEPGDYAMAAARAFRPDVLTVGFARRAAGYKRFSLLLHDRERLLQLLTGERPIQLVLAGKSHPQDEEAKRILQSVFGLKWASPEADSVVFLEDYDIGMAKHLVAGCDVWLNVPRAPLEASGTSGMKAALGGALNLSVLDGWWEEAFDGTNGWAIASDAGVEASAQDAADAEAMYSLMETQVVPLFYERDRDGLPVGWLRLVRSSLRTVGARFTAARMLRDYLATAYRRE